MIINIEKCESFDQDILTTPVYGQWSILNILLML